MSEIRPWVYRAILMRAEHRPVAEIAAAVGKTVPQVQRQFQRDAVKAEMGVVARAAKALVVREAATVQEALACRQLRAAEVLGEAMEQAAAEKNTKEMRASAAAVLTFGGNGPDQKVQVQHAHVVLSITDPEVLRRMAVDRDYARQVLVEQQG